jgi:hypothetical protein
MIIWLVISDELSHDGFYHGRDRFYQAVGSAKRSLTWSPAPFIFSIAIDDFSARPFTFIAKQR